jgi:hypothetical protein
VITVKKISSRSRDLPDTIARREDFQTYGALRGGWVEPSRYIYAGELRGYDAEVFSRDMYRIRYIVWSYSTPIAWWVADTDDKNMPRVGHWHIVRQRFSVTTSRHQGTLYRISDGHRWGPWFDSSVGDSLACRYSRGEHVGPVGYTDDGTMCERHYNLRPAVKRSLELSK